MLAGTLASNQIGVNENCVKEKLKEEYVVPSPSDCVTPYIIGPELVATVNAPLPNVIFVGKRRPTRQC